MDSVYIFTHIPKTAGTSIRHHFSTHLKNHEEFIHLSNRGSKQAERSGKLNFYLKSKVDRNKAKVILGHQVNKRTKELIDREHQEVVVFRDPVDWEISRFNQYANNVYKQHGKQLTLKEWFEDVKKVHSQFDWFLINYALLKPIKLTTSIEDKIHLIQKETSHFKYVFSLSNLSEKLSPIFEQLKIPLKIKKIRNAVGVDKKSYFKKSPENIRVINEFCQAEIEIYNSLIDKGTIRE